MTSINILTSVEIACTTHHYLPYNTQNYTEHLFIIDVLIWFTVSNTGR